MRLTLRTLLSWKDGMLETDAARELALKIQASEAARRLADRIDEVAGRPTLSTPAPEATGFADAANSTAEYLDNVLADRDLGEFERVCFASDAHLAETAACHEILATWSHESAGPLDATARRRLLAAVRARAEGGNSHGVGTPRPVAFPGVPSAAGGRPGTRRTSASAWALVAAALMLLVALGGILGWSLTKGRTRPAGGVALADAGDAAPPPPVAPPEGAAVADSAAPRADVAPVVEPAPHAAVPPAVAVPAPTVTAAADPGVVVAGDGPADPATAAAPSPPEPGGIEAAPEPAMPASPAGLAAAAERVPHGDALAIAAVPAPGPPPSPAVPPPAVAPAVVAPAVAGSAVLFQRPAGGAAEAWTVAVPGTPLELPADLVAPPFGRPTIGIDGSRIVLEPGSRATLLRDVDGLPRLEIVFGGATVAGDGPFGVTAGGLAGVVTTGLAAPVGVEVSLVRRPGAPAEDAARIVRVVSTAAETVWRPTAADAASRPEPVGDPATVVRVPVGQALVWRSGAPDAAVLESAGPLPAWLAGRRDGDPVAGRAADALARRLAAGSPAVPALRELAADRRAEARMAAAAALALLGEFTDVARLLAADGHAALPDALWSRLEAAAVQPALARGPRAADALARALADQGPPGAVDMIVRCGRGFTDDELDAGAAVELVTALESPHLVVRRYAIKNLVEITGADGVDRLRYRADRPVDSLREGVAWWRTQLERGRIRRGAAVP